MIRARRSNELASWRPRSVWARNHVPVLQAPSVLCNLRASKDPTARSARLRRSPGPGALEDQFGHLGVGQRVRINRLEFFDHEPQTHVRMLANTAVHRTLICKLFVHTSVTLFTLNDLQRLWTMPLGTHGERLARSSG